MDVGLSSIALTFGTGLASVASPCVLPVVPIILSGTSEDHRSRPALIVAGIAASFVCVGPMLSSVLALVASKGSMTNGVMLLLVYSLGFAVPMLAVGYGSQALRQRVRAVSSHPVAVRWASGLLLVTFGVVILTRGMLFAGM